MSTVKLVIFQNLMSSVSICASSSGIFALLWKDAHNILRDVFRFKLVKKVDFLTFLSFYHGLIFGNIDFGEEINEFRGIAFEFNVRFMNKILKNSVLICD